MSLIALILLAVTLSPPFGEAEARAVQADATLVLEVFVEVSGGPNAVLVRGVGIAGELEPTALTKAESGRWEGIVTIVGIENIRLAFEALYPDGRSVISDASRLIQLGVDPVVFGAPPPRSNSSSDVSSLDPWLLVAIAAGLLAVALISPWLFSRPRSEGAVDKLSANTDNTTDADNSGRDRDEPGGTDA